MKNILVLTDFSEVSGYAVDAAVLFAKKSGASVFILHKLVDREQLRIPLGKGNGVRIRDFTGDTMVEEIRKWDALAGSSKLDLNFITCSEDIISGINDFISDQMVDLVIMGATGKGRKQDEEWGSVTELVIKKIRIPLLILKNPLDDLLFKNVVFASSFDSKEKETFKLFLKLMQVPRDATIHLLSINTESYYRQPATMIHGAMEDFVETAKPLMAKKHFYRDYNVNAGIRHFNKQLKPDLVVMSVKIRKKIKHILFGNEAIKVAQRSKFPVLIMDY